MDHFCYMHLCFVFVMLSCLVFINRVRANLMALVCDVLLCFSHFPCGVLGQVSL